MSCALRAACLTGGLTLVGGTLLVGCGANPAAPVKVCVEQRVMPAGKTAVPICVRYRLECIEPLTLVPTAYGEPTCRLIHP